MIDPYDYDSRQEYLQAMSDEFDMPISSIVQLGEITGDGNMGFGEGLVAELYFHLQDYQLATPTSVSINLNDYI